MSDSTYTNGVYPESWIHEDGVYPPNEDQQKAYKKMNKYQRQKYELWFMQLEQPGIEHTSKCDELLDNINNMTEYINKWGG